MKSQDGDPVRWDQSPMRRRQGRCSRPPPAAGRRHQAVGHLQAGKRVLARNQTAWPLDLGLPAPRREKIKKTRFRRLSHAASAVWSWPPKRPTQAEKPPFAPEVCREMIHLNPPSDRCSSRIPRAQQGLRLRLAFPQILSPTPLIYGDTAPQTFGAVEGEMFSPSMSPLSQAIFPLGSITFDHHVLSARERVGRGHADAVRRG